jgi:ribosomal protein S18 acetylase RimI-like enzyme
MANAKKRSYEIIPALRRDLPAVVDLWQESVRLHSASDDRFTPSPDAIRHYYDYLSNALLRRDHHLRVAKLGKEFLGFCLSQFNAPNPIFPHGPMGFLADLAVTQNARRCGIGQALTQAALDWMQENGVQVVHVTVSVYNESAQKFWRETMGFQPYMDRLWLDLPKK